MNNIKHIIFDFDGTLADTAQQTYAVLNEALRKRNLPAVREDEIDTYRMLGAREIIKKLPLKKYQLPGTIREIRLGLKDVEDIELFNGVKGVIKKINNSGCLISVVTSNGADLVHKTLKEANIKADNVVCDVSVFGKSKKIKSLVKMSGVSKEHTIYIGDETRDISAAKTAGVLSGVVGWGYNHPAKLQEMNPTTLFEQLEDIGKII